MDFGWMDGYVYGWMDVYVCEWMNVFVLMDVYVCEWMDVYVCDVCEWMDEWMYMLWFGWMYMRWRWQWQWQWLYATGCQPPQRQGADVKGLSAIIAGAKILDPGIQRRCLGSLARAGSSALGTLPCHYSWR